MVDIAFRRYPSKLINEVGRYVVALNQRKHVSKYYFLLASKISPLNRLPKKSGKILHDEMGTVLKCRKGQAVRFLTKLFYTLSSLKRVCDSC